MQSTARRIDYQLVNPKHFEGSFAVDTTRATITINYRPIQKGLQWVLCMWPKKKEIFKQIEAYEKNKEFLQKFAKFTGVEKVQDVTRQNLIEFYKQEIEPTSSMYFKLEDIKYINKFLKAYAVPLILRTDEVVEYTPNSAIIEAMKTLSKHNPTPRTQRNKLIVKLKDKGWSFAEICAEMNLRSRSTVHHIYWREKERMAGS